MHDILYSVPVKHYPLTLNRYMENCAAVYIAAKGVERSRHYMGGLWTFHATGKDTGGRFALMEVHTRRGLEPPPHIHTKEDELYYLLEGEMQFIAGDAEHVLSPGQSIFLPKNIPHQFRVLSSEAGFLVEVSPAGLEEMFIALSRPAETLTLPPMPSGPPPPEFLQKLRDLQRIYGITGIDNTKIVAS
jgi:quercetin dioxygenase-like cupin family protein